MKNYALRIIIFVCMSAFALGTYAATVLIDPATQESPSVGELLTVDVNMRDVTGLYGCSFDLLFDKTALKLSAIEQGEFLGSDGASAITFLNNQAVDSQGISPEDLALIDFQGLTQELIDTVNSISVISIATSRLGSDVSINGSGKLVTITFQVIEVKSSTLELYNALYSDPDQAWTEGIAADMENGTVTLPAVVIKGDVDGNGVVDSRDATMVLQMVVGLVEVNDAADVNDDGVVDSRDAIEILQIIVGSVAPGVDVAATADGRITIALADAHGVAGESIVIPVEVDDAYELAGGDMSIRYDQTVLRAVDVSSDDGKLLVSNLNEPGTVRIAFAGTNKRSSKTIARIKFDILADRASPLAFQSVKLYNHSALPLISRSIDRKFISWAMPPEHNRLLQNFPNPFNPETWIPYQLRDGSEVTIRIYNAVGELVRLLDVGHKDAGLYVSQDRAAYWDGKNKFGMEVASGIYFYSIRAGDFAAVRKLIVLR